MENDRFRGRRLIPSSLVGGGEFKENRTIMSKDIESLEN